MDYLWTPWRYQYVTKAAGKTSECVFCAARTADDKEALIVYRGQHTFIILNRFPYTSGHIMVVPYEHVGTLEDVADDALTEMIRLAQTAEKHLRAIYHPDGLNLGMNIGHSAGAGIASHVHLHVLPRWIGDTNFTTVIGETRVLPEALEATWEKLRGAFGTA
jgi:ATP adenylyltransferase